jgi:hypothetical protein
MTDTPGLSPDNPHDLLASTREWTRKVRAAQRGTWFPLLLLGALTLGAIPTDRFGHYAGACQTIHPTGGPPGKACLRYDAASMAYWTVALILAYALIALFYIRRSRVRGVGTPIAPYIAAGAAIAAVVTAITIWRLHDPLGLQHNILGVNLDPPSGPLNVANRLACPAGAIGLALLVLSRVERNLTLALFSIVYLVAVLLPPTVYTGTTPTPWAFLPRLATEAALLLAAALAFALLQLRPTPTAA